MFKTLFFEFVKDMWWMLVLLLAALIFMGYVHHMQSQQKEFCAQKGGVYLWREGVCVRPTSLIPLK